MTPFAMTSSSATSLSATPRRRWFAAAACLLTALAAVAPKAAWAQADWPSKPIKIVVPYAPGGSSDMLGRLIARYLQDTLKQTVVVENKGGAGGVIGSKEVSKAAPDGYTLVVSGIGSHVIAPVDQPGAFDPMKDFTHIAMLAGPPLGMVVNAEQPIKDVKGFIAAAQSNPAGISWGSPGQGTHGHLTGELFRQTNKVNMVHISYKGAGPAVADLLGNQIPAAFMTLSSSNAHVDTGRLRLLAVSSAKRVAQYPNTPTLAELGYPQLTGTTWFSISGPAGMPRDVVDKLNAEIRRGLQTPALMKALAAESMETMDLDAAGFSKYVASEITRWTPAVKSLASTSK
jgi:tripartite-type tricarboxylate transporter receptor subunit TctC